MGMKLSKTSTAKTILVSSVRIIVGIAFSIIVFCGWSFLTYGELYKGWLFFSGVRLYAENRMLNLGEIPVGETASGIFQLQNISWKPVAILGIETSCSCIVMSELPLTVPPYKSVALPVMLQTSHQQSGPIEQELLLNLNIEQSLTSLMIKAVVIGHWKNNPNSQYKGE
jgi:hypothetical protein